MNYIVSMNVCTILIHRWHCSFPIHTQRDMINTTQALHSAFGGNASTFINHAVHVPTCCTCSCSVSIVFSEENSHARTNENDNGFCSSTTMNWFNTRKKKQIGIFPLNLVAGLVMPYGGHKNRRNHVRRRRLILNYWRRPTVISIFILSMWFASLQAVQLTFYSSLNRFRATNGIDLASWVIANRYKSE